MNLTIPDTIPEPPDPKTVPDTIADTVVGLAGNYTTAIAVAIVAVISVVAIRQLGGAAAGIIGKFQFPLGILILAVLAIGWMKLS